MTLLLSISVGVFPALLWLWFWLKEDRINPEPRQVLAYCFLGGMVSVLFVLPLQAIVYKGGYNLTMLFIVWAFIEEAMKFLFVYLIAFQSKAYDEPIDAVIYMITGALGFAAAENVLFLLDPFIAGDIITGLMTGSMRFIGPSLLHIVASATLGAFIAFSFYSPKKVKHHYMIAGLFFATLIHIIFNLTMASPYENGPTIALYTVWCAAIVLVLIFERIKKIRKKRFIAN